ncbi:MAG TPA: ferric reductase-like transmembrane domain-containing protein [Spirochaetia bacterium]|nr:ferric reductase-like transmembrane domain-containing protein [Spirochaetia bacterium]
MRRMRRILLAGLWISLYVLLTLSPILVLLIGVRPAGRELWRDFSVALGYCGLAMWMLQFVLTARFKTIKSPFGSDAIYYFHRQISLASFLLVLVHPLILFVFSPALLSLLNPVTAPWRARMGMAGLAASAALILTSVFRRAWKIEYTRWRVWHGILAVLAVGLAFSHVYLAGYYLNTPWKRELWIVYSAFWIGLLLWVRVLKPWSLLANPHVVSRVAAERGGATSLFLKKPKGAVARFLPGQFAWLTAGASPFADAEHPFSISSSAEERREICFTVKELGDFTSRIRHLAPGSMVYVDGPFGAFSCDRHPHAEGFLFVAGGIGVTPIMSMLRTLADRGDRRPLVLLYANRTWEAVTFREEIEGLGARLNLRVVHVLEKPPDGWTGARGFVTEDLIRSQLPAARRPNEWEVFLCGPPPMMDAVERSLGRLGVSPGDIHSERFNLV